jgi:hypothetical protein
MPRIQVTQKNIDDGIPEDSTSCMIADAIKAAMPYVRFVSADISTIRYSNPKTGLRHTFLTPEIAQWALVQYDQGVKPEPFHFNLDPKRAHKTSMVTTTKEGKQKPVHKLGPARIVPHKDQAHSVQHEIIGGKPPPKLFRGMRRRFGTRVLPRPKGFLFPEEQSSTQQA